MAPVVVDAQMAHAAHAGPGGGRTLVIITLSGADLAGREALGERAIAAVRAALAPAPAVNRLAAVFAQLSQPPPLRAETVAVESLRAGMVLPAEPPRPAVSPYETPFLLAPLHRRKA